MIILNWKIISVSLVIYLTDNLEKLLRMSKDILGCRSLFQVLFEQDNDCISVSTIILDALLLCPIDTR